MKRITTERVISPSSFQPMIKFYKDGDEFARLNLELIQDLTFKSPPNFPFKGPELSMEDAKAEILEMLKCELNDPELEGELVSVLTEM